LALLAKFQLLQQGLVKNYEGAKMLTATEIAIAHVASPLLRLRIRSINTVNWSRVFKGNFGMRLEAVADVWEEIDKPAYVRIKHLLWALYYLKIYPTDECACAMFGISAPTWRRWTREVIDMIRALDVVRVRIFLDPLLLSSPVSAD
jgi:hypothetical protein